MSAEPVWEGEVLSLIQARRDVIAASLNVALEQVSNALETGSTYAAVTTAAYRLVSANEAYQAKRQAIEKARGL